MITKIGENAGLVWGALQNGAQGLKALKKATKLKNEDRGQSAAALDLVFT